jgi:Bacterial Ig-like domain (group 3)
MTVTPSARAGATVTLTATVAAADGTSPAGWVLFAAGGTAVGSPVAVAGGRATTGATFATAGPERLSAVFSSSSPAYLDSSGGYTARTDQGGARLLAGGEPRSGLFSVTIKPGTVTMTVSGATATGALRDITVTDSRDTHPGWLISGQASAFAGAGTATGWSIPGSQLGWTPTAVGGLHDGATLGRAVVPAKPGLGITTAAATLAEAPPGSGSGTNVLSANLTLAIPPGTVPGPYAGAMTITYFVAGPQN